MTIVQSTIIAIFLQACLFWPNILGFQRSPKILLCSKSRQKSMHFAVYVSFSCFKRALPILLLFIWTKAFGGSTLQIFAGLRKDAATYLALPALHPSPAPDLLQRRCVAGGPAGAGHCDPRHRVPPPRVFCLQSCFICLKS